MRLETYVVRKGPVSRAVEETLRKRREAAEATARAAREAAEAAEEEAKRARREAKRAEMAKVAEEEVAETDGHVPSVLEIKRAVCSHFCVSHMDMMSRRRSAEIVTPRHIAMFLAKQMTLQSLPQIARAFGRDHTTVLHGVRHIGDRIAAGDERVSAHVAAVRVMLEARQ